MTQTLSTIFASPFLDLDGLKRAALYFDKIKMASELTIFAPTAREQGPFLRNADAVSFITPETVLDDISLLIKEHIVDVTHLNHVLPLENELAAECHHKASSTCAAFHREVFHRMLQSRRTSMELSKLSLGYSDSLLLMPSARTNDIPALAYYYTTLYFLTDAMINLYYLPVCTDSAMLVEIMQCAYKDKDFLDHVLGHKISPWPTNHLSRRRS
jgi:hypothetical protein